jgi:NADH-quinone oxidoreductase subunit D
MAETPTIPQDQRQPIELVARDEDLTGEHMILNMGPSHPSTHGVLRIVLELDGEKIVGATPDIGYLHRGMEKIAEDFTYNKFVPYTDRFDYLSPMANNVAYTCAVERCLGIEIPPRAQAIRVILSEMARISSHMLGIGCFAMDLGAMTVFLWTFTEREHLYDLFELICGARFTTSYTRVGGLFRDMPEEFPGRLRSWLGNVTKTIDEVDALLTRNKIWVIRTKDVGVISAEDAVGYGLTGANLRASGVEWDVRKNRPYLGYENYDFEVPMGTVGDCYDRYMLRIEEMRQSVRIIQQALDKLPDGPVCVEDGKVSLPEKGKVLSSMEELIHQFMVVTEGNRGPAGEAWFSQENPKGELGFYVVSDGSGKAYRLRIRSPSFNTLGILPKILPGCLVADTVAILGSFDFVMGECDR